MKIIQKLEELIEEELHDMEKYARMQGGCRISTAINN